MSPLFFSISVPWCLWGTAVSARLCECVWVSERETVREKENKETWLYIYMWVSERKQEERVRGQVSLRDRDTQRKSVYWKQRRVSNWCVWSNTPLFCLLSFIYAYVCMYENMLMGVCVFGVIFELTVTQVWPVCHRDSHQTQCPFGQRLQCVPPEATIIHCAHFKVPLVIRWTLLYKQGSNKSVIGTTVTYICHLGTKTFIKLNLK